MYQIWKEYCVLLLHDPGGIDTVLSVPEGVGLLITHINSHSTKIKPPTRPEGGGEFLSNDFVDKLS